MGLSNFAQVTTTLGPDVLRLKHATGREEIGRLFEYELDLISENDEIKLHDVLAQPMTIELQLDGGGSRHFNGIVSRFGRTGSSGRFTQYRATLRPWLWLLTRTSDCRIFQRMSVPDVVKQVFRDLGFTDFDEALTQSYDAWEYLAQYRESSFNFVSRLMEQEGIYYFFRHEEGKHTLVLADSYSAHAPVPGYAEVPYYPPLASERRERDHLDGWGVSEQIQAGAYMLNEFDFERPKASLQAKLSAEKGDKSLELYDYPGEYTQSNEGEFYVRVRLEEVRAQCELIEARGNARGLAAGSLFSLTNYPRADQNREYLITSNAWDLEVDEYESAGSGEGSAFRCTLSGVESKTPYRLQSVTPKPTISGPQTAIVVGKAGEEIWTDEYARVKVQFHWDREGKSNENSSCWVRVAQYWAGSRFGSIHIPRIGQEVIVEFMEGDPDRPIITGRVYNGNNMPPYDLPANQTQSGWKSRSSKGGNPDNFNEIRFEDKKGSEQVFVQAEKDLEINVKNNESRTVGADRSKSVGGSESVSIGSSRTETVGTEESITIGTSRTETVGTDETITIGANRTETVGSNETITIGASRTETVAANETISIGGSRTENVASAETVNIGGARTLNVAVAESTNVGAARMVNVGAAETKTIGGLRALSIGAADTITVGGNRGQSIGGNESLNVGGNVTINAGKKLVINAADEITIKTGDATIQMKKNGDITIKGKNITIQGSAKIAIKADSDLTLKGSKIGQN